MARLPTPGGDDGTWGDILNEFLEVSHASDGAQKEGTARISSGIDSGKPAAESANRLYYATDTNILYRDTGIGWVEIARGETSTRLASLSEKAHGSLTGTGTNTHAQIDTHLAATTNVHGITDTANLAAANHVHDSHIITFSYAGALEPRIGAGRFRLPYSATIIGISAMVDLPSTSAIILDVNKNGTTIFTTQSNRPQIAGSAYAAAEITNMDITSLIVGDYLTVDIDQATGFFTGNDLTVMIRYQRSA
jgi:hypothetical protein